MIAPVTAMPSVSASLWAVWKRGTAGEPSGACGRHRLEIPVNERVPQLLDDAAPRHRLPVLLLRASAPCGYEVVGQYPEPGDDLD
jgi:hypothetical protein